ncbi:hypothetical protein ScalyP_jg8617 [Parmales sp. scaly parma]|nr:hypothetical protein ScalyP_jg8617 [Parmales sp. scaly parma]
MHPKLILLALCSLSNFVSQAFYYYDDGDDNKDDVYAVVNDDGNNDDGNDDNNNGGGMIQDWTKYVFMGLRCVTVPANNKDYVMYELYEDSIDRECKYNHDMTIIVPIYSFLTTLTGNKDDDYELDEDLVECTYNGDSYFKLGCDYCSTKEISYVEYSDDECTVKVEQECFTADTASDVISNSNDDAVDDGSENGDDDANDDDVFDLSKVNFAFGDCLACAEGGNDDENANDDGSDGFCAQLWANSLNCDNECQQLGLTETNVWTASRKFLFSVLFLVGVYMAYFIIRKRNAMASKDRLMEEAIMMTKGVRIVHIIGFMSVMLFVVMLLAITGEVTLALASAIFMDTIMGVYILKLTLFSKKSVDIGA